MLCLQFALQILCIIQIKLGYENIWVSCRRLRHSNLEINIDSLIQILHCDWSLCCIRRSGYFSVATKYLCFDTKDFFAHTNSKFALWIMFNSKWWENVLKPTVDLHILIYCPDWFLYQMDNFYLLHSKKYFFEQTWVWSQKTYFYHFFSHEIEKSRFLQAGCQKKRHISIHYCLLYTRDGGVVAVWLKKMTRMIIKRNGYEKWQQTSEAGPVWVRAYASHHPWHSCSMNKNIHLTSHSSL